MREIKFRAWDGNKMQYTGKLYTGNPLSKGQILDWFECVMQYTGLKDKKGVDIYEGDIVHYTEPLTEINHIMGEMPQTFIGYVEYVEELCGFRVCTEYGQEEPIHPDITIEVIGNIDQHPELLEDKPAEDK